MNLLELKGRDRDKLILLKRDTKFAPSRRQWKEGRGFPYYSTNRNKAWELWDELLKSHRYLFLNAASKGKWVIYATNKEEIFFAEDIFWIEEGNSFADAVSKAWLKWYYNTQWLKK